MNEITLADLLSDDQLRMTWLEENSNLKSLPPKELYRFYKQDITELYLNVENHYWDCKCLLCR